MSVSAAGFVPWRIAADPDGGVWVLDRQNGKLGRVQGMPLPDAPVREYSPDTFRPCEENPDPPRLTVLGPAIWNAETWPVSPAHLRAGLRC